MLNKSHLSLDLKILIEIIINTSDVLQHIHRKRKLISA
jgi:hypothetical protein